MAMGQGRAPHGPARIPQVRNGPTQGANYRQRRHEAAHQQVGQVIHEYLECVPTRGRCHQQTMFLVFIFRSVLEGTRKSCTRLLLERCWSGTYGHRALPLQQRSTSAAPMATEVYLLNTTPRRVCAIRDTLLFTSHAILARNGGFS